MCNRSVAPLRAGSGVGARVRQSVSYDAASGPAPSKKVLCGTHVRIPRSYQCAPRRSSRSPRVKMDGAELAFYLGDGYGDQRDHT